MVERRLIEEKTLACLRPTEDERKHIDKIAQKILSAISESRKAEGMVVGSIARHTWLRGDHDLDIFMLFDPSLPREELELQGLSLARYVAASFTNQFHEKYAEHPYINAIIDEIDVDLVPCYKVESAEKIQSAVDRTPFHTRYITDKINGLVDDVLLLKRFAKAGGIYGSDQMTEGFSGYLCELLILHYGGFNQLLQAASAWRPQQFIDPEHHATKQFDEPLIVIDPVDPRRNVAAAVSIDRMTELVELARGYLAVPSEAFFHLRTPQSISKNELGTLLAQRKTSLISITFSTPPYIEEVVVPQLKRSVIAIEEHLERSGFAVHHASYDMKPDQCMLLFELLVKELPRIRRHAGPPVWNRENAEKFRDKHRFSGMPGPYITKGRYEMEVLREFTQVRDLLGSQALLEISLGKHVRQSLAKGWCINEAENCWSDEFSSFIAGFFQRYSPLTRIEKMYE
jgi:tRNA nucleotidyltransferase (CCA-adding enzyme)